MSLDQTVKGGRPFVPVTDAVHAKIGAAGVGVTETWAPPHKTIFNFSDTLLPTVNAAGVGYGNIKLYDFEAGVIQILGVVVNLTLRNGPGISVSAPFVGSLGSVPAAADGALTSTEVDVIASTNANLNAQGVGTFGAKTGAAPLQMDGHTTPADLYLNLATPSGSTANGGVYLTGQIVVEWTNLGDY